jgi:hypothetical protein
MIMGGGKKNMVVRGWVDDDEKFGDVLFRVRGVISLYIY